MSLVDGISGALGNRTTIGGADQRRTLGTGSTPGSPTAAQGVANRFGTVFQTSFSSNMATVFEKGAHGDFDDPTLALQEQAALARLRAAQASAGTPATPSTGVPGAGTGGERGPGAGASAAPDAGAASTTTPAPTTGPTPATTTPGATPPTSGTATTSAGGPASTAASGGSTEVVAEQRELYGVRVRQSEARLANISASLRADYPAAARLASASTGWDPETFVPKTKEEAEAFAQRMVIDATESAARLEIVKTQLDSATFEAQTTGSPAATAQAAKLQADFDRQKTYVDKLARIVDTAAGGAVTDKGADAMRGQTMRNEGDIPIAEMVTALRDAGMTEGQIARTVGASELGVEQERTPGGSETLKTVAKTSADWTWANRFNLQQARRAEDRRIEAKRRETQADEDEQRQWQRNVDRNRDEKRAFTAHLETRAAERKARSDSQFQSYLQRIQAERRQARAG